jgi:predicted Zn-dependent protease with MMP-like domain
MGLHHCWAPGGYQHAPGGGADRQVTARTERLARYALARRRLAPRTSMKAFETLVAEALDELPDYVRTRLENVAVIVEDGTSGDLLGLYEGVNRVDRASGYHLVTPDRITLYWRPIIEEVGGGGPAAIRREVRKTVIHEVAHHFGIDDAELERLGG